MTRQVRRQSYWPWLVAFAGFVALVGAAGFRSAPGVLIDPLRAEFGWSTATISLAVSVNMLLYGLFSPFAAALMERFGMRAVASCALVLVSAGSGLTVFMSAPWQLVLCWGLLVGVGTGSMAMAFVATLVSRWFVRHRGLVSGVLTAAGAAGQLVFLPLIAGLATHHGWRSAAMLISAAAVAVVPVVWLLLRDHPADLGLTALGGEPEVPVRTSGAGRRALVVLASAARTRTFWLLAVGFMVCGATTNGLIGTHFVPAAHQHGMPATTAAGLLALVGIFDIAGTVASGWLTDRVDSRWLLGGYYSLRGLSLLALPGLLAPTTTPPLWAFIVFYGLDWVATVPPTVALARQRYGASGPIVFGWVFASHQLGAAIAAGGAGLIRDLTGGYDLAWYLAGGLCALATICSLAIATTSAGVVSPNRAGWPRPSPAGSVRRGPETDSRPASR